MERQQVKRMLRSDGTAASFLHALPKFIQIRAQLGARLKLVATPVRDKTIIDDLYRYFRLDVAEMREALTDLKHNRVAVFNKDLKLVDRYETSEASLLKALGTTCGQV
jgi:hypothetical protein